MQVHEMINSAFSGLNVKNEASIEPVAEMLDKFGLRWDVAKESLNLPDGTPTDFFAVVRQDTRKAFTTCKQGYEPYQNSELAELLYRISKNTGYGIHSGGMFNGGGKVYIQLDTHTEIKDLGKNRTTVKGYVTGINGHDGTTSLKWGEVNFTVCCKNTFAMAKGALQNSARHTASIRDVVERAIMEIEGIKEAEKTIFEQFIRLSNVPVNKNNIARVVKHVTGVDITQPVDDKVSGYAKNRAMEMASSIATETSQKGDTLWGLFSGVTHYTSHKMPVPKRENARLESKYVGTGADIDNGVFDMILSMAN